MPSDHDRQQEQVLAKVEHLAKVYGRSVTETMVALLSSRTLRAAGCDGCHLDERQTGVALRLLDRWIERANEHQQG